VNVFFVTTVVCEDKNELCGANPGWPSFWCQHAKHGAHIRENCPAMCQLCTPGIYSRLLFYCK